MTISPSLLFRLAALIFILSPSLEAAKLKLPPWLEEVSVRTVATTKETTAIVLHDEAVHTVSPNGKITTNVRYALRIVTRDGRSDAKASINYDSSTEKITGFRAWAVRPNGEGKTYAQKDTADIALALDTVYAEYRSMVLSAASDVYENCIFAYEYTVENKGIFGQDQWFFQSKHPVALSRVTYVLPKNWSISGVMQNHTPIDPAIRDNTYTWEMRNLPAFKEEPYSPPTSRIFPRLCLDITPPTDLRPPPRLTFPSWTSVSVYGDDLHRTPSTPDEKVSAKAAGLLAAAGPDTWNRINALASYAQGINYVSISMNAGKGGGHLPRTASEVLKTGYGDCKDKTALLRAMLATAGIKSYSVIAYSGNRYMVVDNWITPNQFNHCITAIKIDDPSISSPAIVDHPTLGRLLFFDPTNPYTPLGDLQYDHQGSLVLVLAGENDALVRLPFTAPEANHLDRTIMVEVTDQGQIGVKLVEKSTGQSAAIERAIYRSPSGKYADRINEWINNTVRAAKITKNEVVDDQINGRFDLTTEFVAPGYAQSMRGKLLIFKPAIVNRRDFVPLTEPERKYPVILEPRSYAETTDILIPEGFNVDELPPTVDYKSDFARYLATCIYDANTHQICYKRSLTINAAEIPAKDYTSVRQFYETVRKAEQTPVVLSRK